MDIIEDFGPRVTSVWKDMRSTTRSLVERAWQTPPAATAIKSMAYDPRADQELSKLLRALDEQAREIHDPEAAQKARRLADACANILAQQTQSAEIFAELITRAHERKDFARVDALAGAMSQRLAPSEICELGRSGNVIVRALAHEALAHMPPSVLVTLLHDPVDAAVARAALERQAVDYASEEAQQALEESERFDADDS